MTTMGIVMKYLVILSCACSLFSMSVKMEGPIPSRSPESHGISFLPYNANALIIGEKIAKNVTGFAAKRLRGKVLCFTTDPNEFKALAKRNEEHPNIYPLLGFPKVNKYSPATTKYYDLKAEEQISYGYLTGSTLQPIDNMIPELFGGIRTLPLYSISNYLTKNNMQKIHYMYIDGGGRELEILQTMKSYLNDAIVIKIKTYQRKFRKNMNSLQSCNLYLKSKQFELLSHYVYDDLVGTAYYVKSKYVDGVYRSKEL